MTIAKIELPVFILIAFLIFSPALNATEGVGRNETVIKGKYLGERFPGLQLRLFSDTVVSSLFDENSGPVLTKNGREIYWSIAFDRGKTGIIMYMKMNDDNRWTLPENAPFSNEDYRDLNPYLSPDGKTMYFTSRRPLKKSGKPGDINVWKIHRTQENKWSEPVPVEALLNFGNLDAQVTVGRHGTIYFAAQWPGGNGKYDLYICTYKNGKYNSPRAVSGPINTEHSEFAPYVDPDERFILFASDRPGGYGNADLYISRRRGDTWSKPKNLGKAVNTEENETYTSISPDNRYLFIIAQRDDDYNVHWISTRILK